MDFGVTGVLMVVKHKKEHEAEISLDSLKKNWSWIILALILIFGFYLRAYHLDYPVIGYHNWKESHYLTEARNFARDGNWLTPMSDFPGLNINPEGAHGDTLPLTSWFTAAGFMIFGDEVWVARLISVLFVMASVLLLYLIIKKLFKREDLALTAALIMAANPLLVFFGRQVQVINPALFFGMLSVYLYLLWLDDPMEKSRAKYLVLASASFIISFMTKYTFALLAIPMLALFPYREILDKKHINRNWKTYLYAVLPVLLIPLWVLNNRRIVSQYPSIQSKTTALLGDINVKLSTIFGSRFWGAMKPYAADNYTLIGVLFAAIGLVLFFLLYMKNKKSRGNKFLFAYILITAVWVFVMGKKLSQHSYHQYPVAPLVIILIAFCFVVIAGTLEKLVKIKHTRWVFIAGLFLLLIYPPIFKFGGGIFEAKDRQFDTQFYGLDIAGDYLKKNSKPDERLFFSGHQSHGIIWEADRKGTAGKYGEWHYNESVTRSAEEKYNFRWIFMYNWGLEVIQKYPERWEYIKSSYSLRQVAFQNTPQGAVPLYMLFEKGGSYNESQLNSILEQKQKTGQVNSKEYELTRGNVQVVWFGI